MSDTSQRNKQKSIAGLSLVEVLLTVAVLSTVATVSTLALSRITKNAQHQKMDSDLKTLNSAIQVYLSNGGSLAGLSDPDDVLRKLKSSRSKADKELHVGAPSGRMIDSRVSTSVVAADSWKARAVFNSSSERFELVSGTGGVEFILDESLAEVRPDLETRSPGVVSFAENSTWVWDHVNTSNPNSPNGPSSFNVDAVPADSTPSELVSVPVPPEDDGSGNGNGSNVEDETDKPKQAPRLPRPRFNLSGGAHPEDEFDLSVSISNLPDPLEGTPIYKLNGSAWTPYNGSVDVPMNSTLRAQFLTVDATLFRDSSVKSSYFYPVPESLSGSITGQFHSPKGGPNLYYNFSDNNTRFTHGDPVYMLDGTPVDSGTPNSLHFDAQSFSDVPPGQKFRLGNLSYHNGNSYYDSHATGINLSILINLPERGESIRFDLRMDLVNTENDPDDPAASADFVEIKNLSQNISLKINDVPYKMILEFGATDSFGFSTKNSFHVYEGASGTGELLGTFLPR